MSERTLAADYKLGVLYLLDHTEGPLTVSQIFDILLGEVFPNYFLLQQAISELEQNGLETRKEAGNISYHRITDQGHQTVSALEGELSVPLKKEILSRAESLGIGTDRRNMFLSDYKTSRTGYLVRLRVLAGKETQMDLSINVPTLEAAKALCEHWPLRAESIYENVLDKLM